jgi:hypothetical protein
MIDLISVRFKEAVPFGGGGRHDALYTSAQGFTIRWDGGVVYVSKGNKTMIVPLGHVAVMEPDEEAEVKRGPGRPPKVQP